MNLSLNGKTAVITGASRGLGWRLAKAFWLEGANVILVARSKDKLDELCEELEENPAEKNQKAVAIAADLADTSAVHHLIQSLHHVTENIDILVNNAAVQGPVGKVWENDWKAWEATIQINMLAPIALCRALVPNMIRQGHGKIINLSGGGATAPRENFSAYAVAKVGLVRFSETLAQEVRDFNITVNCVAPGVMNTTLLAAGSDNKYSAAEIANQQANGDANLLKATRLCIYLASQRSNGISGRLISAVWDNWETLHHHRSELSATDIYTLRRIVPQDRGKDWNTSS